MENVDGAITAVLTSTGDRPSSPVTHKLVASFTQDFLISASNLKVILFYIAFLPTFMDVTIIKSYGYHFGVSLNFRHVIK
ncbi:MAG: threonine/homoserine/homoserine lactone efflux protein [Granulosicoccus sp.]